jgi:hypothetical protein
MPPRIHLRSPGGKEADKSKIAAQVAEGMEHDVSARAAELLAPCTWGLLAPPLNFVEGY